MSQKPNIASLFLIQKHERRFISELGPVGEEKLLCQVLVIESDGVSEVRFPSTGEKIAPFDLKGRTVEEAARELLQDEERTYGGAKKAG
ncbi:MAG: hypothetical protein NUW02_02015 [Candidatus Campbellbacteria bacterium]|nr:hypothetical protein [Candidatus Campbellbacteria bacterium]